MDEILTISRIGDYLACSGVDRLTGYTGTAGFESGLVRFVDDVINSERFLVRLSKCHGVSSIRSIIIQDAADVYHDEIATIEARGPDVMVWDRGIGAKADEGERGLCASAFI